MTLRCRYHHSEAEGIINCLSFFANYKQSQVSNQRFLIFKDNEGSWNGPRTIFWCIWNLPFSDVFEIWALASWWQLLQFGSSMLHYFLIYFFHLGKNRSLSLFKYIAIRCCWSSALFFIFNTVIYTYLIFISTRWEVEIFPPFYYETFKHVYYTLIYSPPRSAISIFLSLFY